MNPSEQKPNSRWLPAISRGRFCYGPFARRARFPRAWRKLAVGFAIDKIQPLVDFYNQNQWTIARFQSASALSLKQARRGAIMPNSVSIGSNIAHLRKDRGLTQEDIASFLGVTKASVSKWETAQSYPDIELLPQIAMYFGISIDELVGYDPQMGKREIRAACERLRRAFAEEPYDVAHGKCQALVREYYSCWPVLVQVAALYINHLDLAGPDERAALVMETAELCQRVRRGSDVSAHVRQAESIEALLLLANGDAQGACSLLADAAAPDLGADIILSRAYSALGEVDRADETLQAMTYQALILSLNRLAELALLHAADRRRLDAIHRRSLELAGAFELQATYGNMAAIHFTFATAYVLAGDPDGAIACLEDYERACRSLEFPLKLRGDAFFDRIGDWIEEMNDIGTDAPREEALVKRAMLTGVSENPAFVTLADDPRFKRIVKSLQDLVQ